ncbi:hypothetical protein [Xanthomonas sp. NCPPB 2632]|uniref:hypothetical protein n=1 Tax=Xanthomonas sp. NCPPB 2632 TaxID=3240912 RepID=UPI003518BAA7
MSTQPPKWDIYLQSLTVGELQRHLPLLGTFERITMYNRDRTWILLASQDVDVATSDVDELKRLLPGLAESYRFASQERQVDHKRAFRSYVDFVEVCHLLADQDVGGDDYHDPDQLLSTMMAR